MAGRTGSRTPTTPTKLVEPIRERQRADRVETTSRMSEDPSPASGSGFDTGCSSTETRFNQLWVPGTGSGPDPESPVAVDRCQDFVAAGAGEVPGMTAVG